MRKHHCKLGNLHWFPKRDSDEFQLFLPPQVQVRHSSYSEKHSIQNTHAKCLMGFGITPTGSRLCPTQVENGELRTVHRQSWNMFINHRRVREGQILFVLWKKNVNFYISCRCATTAGQLSCVTMRCHALVMASAESTRPTGSGRGSASVSPNPVCNTGHSNRRHLGELSWGPSAHV